jgi:acyl-CoA synthetase (AMP-forming)/AMP-acid ligase II
MLPGILGNDIFCDTLASTGFQYLKYVILFKGDSRFMEVPTLDSLPIGESGDVHEVQKMLNPDAVAVAFPTSGSTGLPKLTTHSHFAIVNSLRSETEYDPSVLGDAGSKYMNSLPFFWLASIPYYPVIICTTSIHLVDAPMTDPVTAVAFTLRVMVEEKITATFQPIFILHQAMKTITEGVFEFPSSLKTIGSGAEKVPLALHEALSKCVEDFRVVYGSTECLSMTCIIDPDEVTDPDDHLSWSYPNCFCELKVVDNMGKLITCGNPGIIHFRSPFTSLGYLSTELIPIADSTKWVNTGDVGIMNEFGRLRVIGRTVDVISRGGSKIYPATIENVIKKFSNVEKVAILGIPDAEMTEEICACVVPSQNANLLETQLREYCSGLATTLGMIFVPKYYLILDDFPKLPIGKTNIGELKSMAMKQFGLK